MSEQNYAGLDYSGPGSTVNRDADTGIRYGVISAHSIDPDSMSCIWDEARDLSYERAKEDLLDRMMASLASEYVEERIENLAFDLKDLYHETSKDDLEAVIKELIGLGVEERDDREQVWQPVENRFNDAYCDDGDRSWLWEKEGYRLENCLISDVFVSKSPYFTYAQQCSPCVPGAGNLDNPFQGLAVPPPGYAGFAEDFAAEAESLGFAKCFCLGFDFFEDEKAPYEVFSVASGKRVVMVKKYRSVAKWPPGTIGTDGDKSDDLHYTRSEAEGVCDLLRENGFGGDHRVFPIWAQVYEENAEVEQ